MGLMGAAFWGVVALVLFAAAGFSWSHGSGPCGDGTTLLWLGLAVFSIGLALISLSVLALPGTLLFVFVGLLLLIGAGIGILVAGAGCHVAIFGYAFPR